MNELISAHLKQLTEFGGSRCILKTPDGPMDAYRFTPQSDTGKDILFYSDAGGIRPALFAMARRLADFGHAVLMPNLYHRLGTYAPFDASTVFSDRDEMERMMNMLSQISEDTAMADTKTCLSALKGQVGVIGYCMGGGMALRAAGHFSNRIYAAASIHGGALATDALDSPHRLAQQMHAKLYLGIAGIDPHFPKIQQERLEAALSNAGRPYQIDVFTHAHHGFAVPDVPDYDKPSAEASWLKIQDFF